VQNKSYLEEMLTAELRREQPYITRVSVSSDGEFAICNVKDRYTVRKLSPAAKEFLRSGDSERLKGAPLFL